MLAYKRDISILENNAWSEHRPPIKKTKRLQQKLNEKKLNKEKTLKEVKREEALRDQIGFLRNQIIERNQKIQKKNELRSEELEGFLTGVEFDDLKNHYGDFNFADLVLQFPNPDQNPQKLCPNMPVDFKLAEEVFDNMLTVMGNDGFSKAQLKLEREAFLYSYLLLDDYDDDKNKFVEYGQNQNRRVVHHNKKHIGHNKQLTDYEEYLNKLQQAQKQQDDDQIQQNIDNFITTQDLFTSLVNLKLSDKSQFNQKVFKSYSLGGFLEKKEGENDTFEWVCKNDRPKDFCTLVRNTILAKLTNQANLHVRQFIAGKGDYIYMAIKSNEEVVYKEAQQSGLAKQLELGYADLLSLEPCDKLFRPLRLKDVLRNAIKEYNSKKNDIQIEIVEKNKKQKLQINLDDMEEVVDTNNEQNTDQKPKNKQKDKNKFIKKSQILYKWILEKNDTDFWNELAEKQIQMDELIVNLANQLNIDTSNEKQEIMNDDQSTTREEWNIYYIYICYLLDYSKKVDIIIKDEQEEIKKRDSKNSQNYVNLAEQNEGFLYRLIFRKAIGESNQVYNDYYKKGFLSQKKIIKNIWNLMGLQDPISPFTKFFYNDKNQKENRIWRQYETNQLKQRSIFLNVEKIKLCNSIVQKQLNISRMIKKGYISNYYPVHDCYQLKGKSKVDMLSQLKAFGLIQDSNSSQTEIRLRQIYKQLENMSEGADFDSDSLLDETKFNYIIPWEIAIDSIRDYFGEKIAIYFLFLKFYTFHLSYISIFGFIQQLIQDYTDRSVSQSYNIVFAIFIIIWSTLFLEFWKREQVIFSLTFGQQGFEEAESERPSFDGDYQRNVTNDDLNEEYYPPSKRKFRIVFNFIYDTIGYYLNNYENHKILSSYENSLIAKIFMFQFFNLFNSCVFIAYFSSIFEDLHLCEYTPGKEDCFQQLKYQIIPIFVSNIGKNIPEIMVPLLKGKQNKKLNQANLISENMKPFKDIDNFIKEEGDLEQYMTNEEVDGTVNDYMELVIQFSFLTLFGLSFPLSFFLAFINNIIEIQVDKLKLIYSTKRPMPSGASNIGTWLIIIDVITFCAIFSNAGLIAYTNTSARTRDGESQSQQSSEDKIVLFTSLLLSFLVLKYFCRFLIPDVPEIAGIINQRHKNAIDTVVRGFQKSQPKMYKTAKAQFNIGNVIEDHTYTADQIIAGLTKQSSPTRKITTQNQNK